MNTLSITIPENPELEEKIVRLSELALRWRVTSQESFEEAGRLAHALGLFEKQIEGEFRPLIKTLDQGHTQALGLLNRFKRPVINGLAWLKAQSRDYLIAEEQKRLKEKERQLKLAQDEACEVKRQQEEAERKQRESDELLRKAAEAEQQGKVEAAETLLEQAVQAAPPPVTPELRVPTPAPAPLPPIQTKVEGLGSRKVWKWRLTDLHQVPRAYLMLNEKLLNSLATSTKGSQQIAGIEFYQDLEIRRA